MSRRKNTPIGFRSCPKHLKDWPALKGSVKEPLKALPATPLVNPLIYPRMPGGALPGELAGRNKIKLKNQDVRRVFCVEDDKLNSMVVMGVDKGEDSRVCMSALARQPATPAATAKAIAVKLGTQPCRRLKPEGSAGQSSTAFEGTAPASAKPRSRPSAGDSACLAPTAQQDPRPK